MLGLDPSILRFKKIGRCSVKPEYDEVVVEVIWLCFKRKDACGRLFLTSKPPAVIMQARLIKYLGW